MRSGSFVHIAIYLIGSGDCDASKSRLVLGCRIELNIMLPIASSIFIDSFDFSSDLIQLGPDFLRDFLRVGRYFRT